MMRLPRLARHTGVYVVAPLIQRGIYFLLIPVFTRYLTPADYGAWGYVIVVGAMLGTLAPLGLLSAYNFALRRPGAWSQPAELVRSAALRVSLVLVTLVSAAAFFAFRRVDLGVAASDVLWLLILAATALGFLMQAAKRRHQMLEEPRLYARVELSSGLVTAAVSFLGVVVAGWGVLGLAVGLLAGTVVGLVAGGGSMLPDLRRPVDRPALNAAFVFGLPLFVHAGAAILLQYVDRFMLERLSSLEELGLYTLAGQIGATMLLLTTATNQAYLPFLYRHFDDRPELIVRAQRYVALFFALVGLAGVLLTGPFIDYVIDPRYAESRFAAQLLLAAGVLHGFYYLMVGRLLILKRTGTIAWATVVAMILNVILNRLWIPRWHADGAAWATVVTELVLFVLMWYFSRDALGRSPSAQDIDKLAAGS
jgi:O-antigen/teichoic acid export membrane protein